MLRMVLLGLLIPLGVGVLSAMELRTPRSEGAEVQPAAETTAAIFDSHGALAKADRLEIAAANNEAPVQPALEDERASQPEDIGIGSSEPPRLIKRHRHDPGSKTVTRARPKLKRKAAAVKPKAADIKAADIKRTAISRRSGAAGDTEPCRLKAFGGLLKALNSTDCEI
ncbi:hypothetical protein [Bradyrhizobium sp.]|uniref:hypothetical protein n=1 Tax=Bradyrhizobium sp. TaxID=376 RepID=UPI004037D9C3